MKKYNVAWIAIVLLVAFTCQACSDDQLKTIATNVDRIALLIKDGREIKDELETQNIISQEEGRDITLALIKVNSALKAFTLRAKTYESEGALTSTGQVELKKLANDMADAVADLIANGTFGVKNPDAQIRINAAIGALRQLTLAIADTVSVIKPKGAK